jgi:hypothetical protein
MTQIDIDELIRILPQLIKENDAVRGAIISALEGVVATKEDIKELIRQMDKRFEAMQQEMDKRFKAMQQEMDRRFNAMEKRFEAIDKRFEAIDKRFEAIDKRFEAMDKRFDAMDHKIDGIATQHNRDYKELRLILDRMEGKEGINFQQTVLELVQTTLQLEKIDPKKIRREIVRDAQGIVFHPGYSTDIDVIIENGNVYLIEVKATARKDQIDHFLQNMKLYRLVQGREITQGIIIALRITEIARDYAQLLGLRVIAGEIIP